MWQAAVWSRFGFCGNSGISVIGTSPRNANDEVHVKENANNWSKDSSDLIGPYWRLLVMLRLSAAWRTSVFVKDCKYSGRGRMRVATDPLSTCMQPASTSFQPTLLCANKYTSPSYLTEQTCSSPPTTLAHRWLCSSPFLQPRWFCDLSGCKITVISYSLMPA